MNFSDLILEQIDQLFNQIHSYFVWLKIVEFSKKLYGADTYKIEVGIDGRYDDEGSTNWIIDYLNVYDKDGNSLDLNCQELYKFYLTTTKYPTDYDCEDEDNVSEMLSEVIDDFFEYNFINDDDDSLFYVDKPPKMDYKITIETLDTLKN